MRWQFAGEVLLPTQVAALPKVPKLRLGMQIELIGREPGEALPIEERSQVRINSDSQSLDGEFGGDTEYEGTYFLLPYYFGLYHGFLK